MSAEWWQTVGQWEELFDRKYAPSSKDGCWNWIGAKSGNGYGVSSINGVQMYAHRAQYERWNRTTIGSGLVVMHSCDNPSCVNPFHLSVGTQKQNLEDAKNKGRMASGCNHGLVKNKGAAARGERIASSKLTADQVADIRRLYVKGKPGNKSEASLSGLARKYSVSFQTISKIVNKVNWK